MVDITHIKPDPKLSKYVRKISVFESKRKIKYRQKLTPSVFTYLSYNHDNIPVSIYENKRIHPKCRLQIAGPKTNKNIYVEYNGKLSQILVEFTAPGFYYLFHKSPSQLVNHLSEMNNFLLQNVCEHLEKELLKLESLNTQIKSIEAFLIDKSYSAIPFIDYIEKGLQFIENHFGNISVNNIVEEIGIGKRQFDRKFKKVVGVTPKYYTKVIRLHYVINLMHSKNYDSIQDLAYQAEFYDLPHFAHRFKELTGFTPNEFIKSDKHIALKYFTDPIK